MNIIIEFATFYFMFWWTMSILYKGNFIQNALERLGNWFNEKQTRSIFLMGFTLVIQLFGVFLLTKIDVFGLIPIVISIVLTIMVIISERIGNILLGISECNFCLENHVATIIAISYSCYTTDVKYLIWGFLCASINSWIRTFIK